MNYAPAACAAAGASEREFSAILGRLLAHSERAARIEAKITEAVDRLQGCRSECEQATECDPIRDGMVGKFDDLLDRLGSTLSRIEDECSTLGRFI